jgi:hypothetical protein
VAGDVVVVVSPGTVVDVVVVVESVVDVCAIAGAAVNAMPAIATAMK